jgi:hypothetical protein
MPCWLDRVVRQPPPRRPQLPLGGILTNIIMTLAGMPMGKALQGQVAGKVTAIGDPAYEDLRRALVWNELAPARRPKLICQAGSKWQLSLYKGTVWATWDPGAPPFLGNLRGN